MKECRHLDTASTESFKLPDHISLWPTGCVGGVVDKLSLPYQTYTFDEYLKLNSKFVFK